MRKLSKKRAKQNREYLKLRKVFLAREENEFCPITGEMATEIHHTYSGKDRNTHFLEVETWIAVSRDGHNWIHDNPKKSRELGYLK
jgi:hypothetical protein